MNLRFIHSGSTVLNLALTGTPLGGWPLGRCSNIVGDKSTGKTLLAIEAAKMFLDLPPEGIKFPSVTYLEGESAFDTEYAGSKLGLPVERVEFKRTSTIEQAYSVVEGACKIKAKGHGHLIVLDSLDSVDAEGELAKNLDEGTYDMAKQKQLGRLFKRLVTPMEDANIHFMVISQIRHNITTLPFAPKWRRSGGKALDFYCSHIVWLHEVKRLKDPATKWAYGVSILAKVTKNKVASPFREASFPLVFTLGIDDIVSLINFLKQEAVPEEHRISRSGAYYTLPGEDERFDLQGLIEHIESVPGVYLRLVEKAGRVWAYFESLIEIKRRAKGELLKQTEPQADLLRNRGFKVG